MLRPGSLIQMHPAGEQVREEEVRQPRDQARSKAAGLRLHCLRGEASEELQKKCASPAAPATRDRECLRWMPCVSMLCWMVRRGPNSDCDSFGRDEPAVVRGRHHLIISKNLNRLWAG